MSSEDEFTPPPFPGGIMWMDKSSLAHELFTELLKSREEIAFRDGYIERVRELDKRVETIPVSNPDGILGDEIFQRIETKLRTTPNEEFDRVISRLTTEEIDLIIKHKDRRRS